MMPKSGPCYGCTERFPACSGNCPKDARGEYGYKAWMADYRKQQVAEKEFKQKQYEDYRRSELCESKKEKWRLGRKYGRK